MQVDGGFAVSLRLCFMAHSVKKIDRVVIQGASARTFGPILYGKLWEPVTKQLFKNEIGVQ